MNSPPDVGGWPDLKSTVAAKDSDGDKMPDEWEIIKEPDPAKSNAHLSCK